MAPRRSSLVVEDELMLRMRAVDIVQDAGFEPLEAVSADEAIRILESRNDISVLFTDIQMPGSMDGLKLAHLTHTRWPHIKIILVSGQIAVTNADKPEDSKFFPKPLEIEQMVLELQKMVGGGMLELLPSLSAENGALTIQNRELRYQLQQAGVHAKALLMRTVLDAEKHQPNNDENQPSRDALTTENDSLKLALEQAGIDAKALLIQAGIEAEERHAAENLQNLIHAELHHRIKNMLATVGAIADQSLRTATSMTHARSAIDGRLAALARAHDLLTRSSWENATIEGTVSECDRTLRSRWRPLYRCRRGHPDRVEPRHRIGDDPERAMHQHNKVRSVVSPRWAGSPFMAYAGGAFSSGLGRVRWTSRDRTDAQGLWHPNDHLAGSTAEGQG